MFSINDIKIVCIPCDYCLHTVLNHILIKRHQALSRWLHSDDTWIWYYQPHLRSVYSHNCAGVLKWQKQKQDIKKKTCNSIHSTNILLKRIIITDTKTTLTSENSPKLEILFEHKLSTERCRRDARGAKLEILFPERSSLSKFIHSPMHPRSCVPARQDVNYYSNYINVF